TDGVIQVSTLEDGPHLLERIARLVSQGLPVSSDAKYRQAQEMFPDRAIAGLAKRLAEVLARPLATWRLNHVPGVVAETWDGSPEPSGRLWRAVPQQSTPPTNLRRAFLCAALFSPGADLAG